MGGNGGIVLLRPAAEHTDLTGNLRVGRGRRRVEFRYDVVRLWRQPVERFLSGGLGTLPLAPLCQMAEGVPLAEALTNVVQVSHAHRHRQ
jgi:hypothetical protein